VDAGRGIARELLDAAVMVLIAVVLLKMAWALVRPLLPLILTAVVTPVVARCLLRRYRNW
jgi:hypothetical protein